ncbi:MAG: Fpg/Nei family DNA glycosylase, partial [Candidatus Corynebacterium faecigallinarum]
MPEGHVIHRLARMLNKEFAGKEVQVSSPQGRWTTEAAMLDGSVMEEAEAWGKHLFIHFPAGIVHIHLGLIGTLTFEPLSEPRGQVRLRIASDDVAADLRGPQRCVLIDPVEQDAALAKLGADPLRPVDPAKLEAVFARTRRSAKPIGALLMDQSLYPGVGSIYRTEVLFRLGLGPTLPGKSLSEEELTAIWDDLVELMAEGEETGRIDTVRAEHTPEAMGR